MLDKHRITGQDLMNKPYEAYLAYGSWSSMRRRCYDNKRQNYKYYGGRGIKVCAEWRDSFPNFLADMGERPSSKYELERINNDGDYSPENCKWVTHQEQTMNRRMRSDNSSGYKGVYKRGNKWAAGFRLFGKYNHLGFYDSPELSNIAYLKARNAV